MTDAQIASLALNNIGHEGVTSFSASGNKASRWFFANYNAIRQSLLREHGWRFARKRAVLTLDPIRTITAISNANPAVVTSAAHGFSNADEVYLVNVVGMQDVNGRTFTVANATTDTFELSGIDSTAYSGYDNGGLAYGFIPTDYANRFALPSDCLRILKVNGREELTDFSVERGWLYANDSGAQIEYIFDNDDEASFDAQFADVFSARLSAEICFYLTDNSTLTEQSWNIYNQKISMARVMDSRQGTPDGLYADNWTLARY